MNDLRDKIKAIIEKETEAGNFSVLDTGKSVLLIEQIISNYKRNGQLQEPSSKEDSVEKKKGELVFVAAPTGAGKDNLVVKLNYQNPEKKYIELNMDIFRQYFSMYIRNIKSMTDKDFASMTNEFSYEIYATVQELILKEFPGTNVIITGTLRETDWVEQVFEKFKNDENTNYTTKLIGLAVPKTESSIAVIYRYLAIVNTQKLRLARYPGSARYTSMKYHDETFEKFPKNFEYFEKIFREEPGRLIDSIEVYTRSKNMRDLTEDTKVYSSDDGNDSRMAVDVINELRNKKYSVKYDDFSIIARRILANKDYLKSQGTLKEVIRTLAEILDYPEIIKRLDQIGIEDNESDLGKN